MIESLIGTLFGGLFRLAPEVLKWLDRKDERKHEILLLDKNIEADKLKAEHGQKLAETEANKQIELADIQTFIEAAKLQSVLTGVKWVDAFNALIRPLMALQWVILLWPAVVIAGFFMAVAHGVDVLAALKGAFGPEEKALASSIAAFFLLDRTLRKK